MPTTWASIRSYGGSGTRTADHPFAPYFRMHTPHLDRLAGRRVCSSSVLTPAPMQRVPNRYELLTGRFVCTYTRGWEPLPAHEIVLAQVLGDAGYTSMFILDTPNLLRDGYHFDRGYTALALDPRAGGRPLPDPRLCRSSSPVRRRSYARNPRYPDGSVVMTVPPQRGRPAQ